MFDPNPRLTQVDVQKIMKDTLYFSLVPITFYITQVLTTIQTPGHILTLASFVPTNGTLIAIVAWILNQILNIIKKYLT